MNKKNMILVRLLFGGLLLSMQGMHSMDNQRKQALAVDDALKKADDLLKKVRIDNKNSLDEAYSAVMSGADAYINTYRPKSHLLMNVAAKDNADAMASVTSQDSDSKRSQSADSKQRVAGEFANNVVVRNAVHNAVKNDRYDLVKNLFKQYPNIDVDARDDQGNTALMYAVQVGNDPMIGFFLNKHANIFAKNNEGRRASNFTSHIKNLDDKFNMDQFLEEEEEYALEKTLEYCRETGATLSSVSSTGLMESLPIIALFHYAKKNNISGLENLVATEKNMPSLDTIDLHGETPLIFAACRGSIDAVAWLLNRGADPFKMDAFDKRAITFASDDPTNENMKAIKKLLSDEEMRLMKSNDPRYQQYQLKRQKQKTIEQDTKRSGPLSSSSSSSTKEHGKKSSHALASLSAAIQEKQNNADRSNAAYESLIAEENEIEKKAHNKERARQAKNQKKQEQKRRLEAAQEVQREQERQEAARKRKEQQRKAKADLRAKKEAEDLAQQRAMRAQRAERHKEWERAQEQFRVVRERRQKELQMTAEHKNESLQKDGMYPAGLPMHNGAPGGVPIEILARVCNDNHLVLPRASAIPLPQGEPLLVASEQQGQEGIPAVSTQATRRSAVKSALPIAIAYAIPNVQSTQNTFGKEAAPAKK